MLLRFALLLLLCSASLPLLAREVRQAGANGDGGCPAATAEKNAGPGDSRGERAGNAKPAVEERAAPASGGNTENSVRGPRWHSFLPGMFR